MRLKNKVALITGASSGIGREIASQFAAEGATVILAARDEAALKKVAGEIKDEGNKASVHVMDITDRTQVIKTVQEIIESHKQIDILVNNAGIARWGSIEDCSYQDFDDHMNINVTGYFNCIKEVVPHMIAKKAGCVINLVSGSGKRARPGTIAYATSKFAAAGMSDALFEDLKKHNINVTAIYPGKTQTPIHNKDPDDEAFRKYLEPKEVAKLAVYAASLSPNVKVRELEVRPLD